MDPIIDTYLALGFSLIPIHPTSKKPLVESWKPNQEHRATKQLIEHWYKTWPEMQLGVVTGKISGIVVVDQDSKDPHCPPGPVPPTVVTKRGYHYYYAYPNGKEVRNKAKLNGYDIRGDGGYAILPPSSMYTWAKPLRWLLDVGGIFPDFPLELLKHEEEQTKSKWKEAVNGTTEGQRNESAASVAGRLLKGQPPDMHDLLWESFVAWNRRNSPVLAEEELLTVWHSIANAERRKQAKSEEAAKKVQIYDFDELLDEDIAPLAYIVGTILPAGLTIFGGRPKAGKSRLALQIGLAVSQGLPLWLPSSSNGGGTIGDLVKERHFDTLPGDVLYLALEDGKRRLKGRGARMIQAATTGGNFKYALEWPRFEEGGIKAIEDWIKTREKPRLVVVDTLARVRQGTSNKGDIFQEDHDAMVRLHDLVRERADLAVIVVHHLSKADRDDIFDRILGTTGMTAVPDTLWAFTKTSHGAVLKVRGRDIDEQDFHLQEAEDEISFDLTDANFGTVQKYWDEVKGLIEREGPLTPKELSNLLSTTSAGARMIVMRLKKAGKLTASKEGRYSIA